MRASVRSTSEVTHSAPNPAATPLGALPASIVSSTRLVAGSTRATSRSSASTTHNDPSANASAVGRSPTGMMIASRSPPSRVTVPSSRFATHTEPPPAAMALGPRPTVNCVVIRPESGSITPTAFSSIRASPSDSVSRVTAKTASPHTTRSAPTTASTRRGGAREGRTVRVGATAGWSSFGSCSSIASWRRRSSGPGSTPICSTSTSRAARYAASASAWRPERYSASIRCACNRSCRGCAATSASSSGSTSAWRPAARSASIALSVAPSRSSSSRRTSAAANGSPATSASASPRHRASASRADPLALRCSKRATSTAVGGSRNSYPRPWVRISAPLPASSLRSCDT